MLDNIDEIRVDDFILSLSNEDNDILELKKYAKANEVPIIRDETKNFMKMILELTKPKKILEIGTAIGYSTLVMHKICPEADIVTLEDFERRFNEANKNINKYFDTKKIKLINIDATIYLNENANKESFDFIFLDAAKGQYIKWLENIKKLMAKGSILIADNIFKDGEILESRYLIKKRDRTIHKRMRDFLHAITHDDELDTYIFNLGDGISVSIRK